MRLEGSPLVRWLAVPIVMFGIGAGGGHAQRSLGQPEFFAAPPLVTVAERKALEGAAATAVANATWAFADARTARRVMQSEFRRLYDSSGPEKARTLIRFAMLDPSPDGRAALFAQACTADPTVCEDRQAAALREVQTRFVAPGNTLPLGMMSGGHPPVEGYP